MTATPTFGILENGRLNPSHSSDEWARFIASALHILRVSFNVDADQGGRPWPSTHIARPERRKAVRLILGVFLRHLDPATLCVGHWSPKVDFIPLSMTTIASEASMGRRRCERAISYLKTVGFVSVSPPQHYYNPIPWAGLRVVRAMTPAFFEWAGLAELLDKARSNSIRCALDDGGQP